jgi:hypothetical protein
MNYVLKTKDPLNEWNVTLCDFIMLWTFQNPKNCNYYFLNYDFFICLITSRLEIGNGKECYFQYNLTSQNFNQFSTTLEKDFEKRL